MKSVSSRDAKCQCSLCMGISPQVVRMASKRRDNSLSVKVGVEQVVKSLLAGWLEGSPGGT